MTSDRIDELIKQTAYPESQSVRSAMCQVWNEMQQGFNSRTCENCKYRHNDYSCKNEEINNMIDVEESDNWIRTEDTFSCNKWEAKDAK